MPHRRSSSCNSISPSNPFVKRVLQQSYQKPDPLSLSEDICRGNRFWGGRVVVLHWIIAVIRDTLKKKSLGNDSALFLTQPEAYILKNTAVSCINTPHMPARVENFI